MVAGYRIGPARRRDLAALPGIERAAAALLAGHAPAAVLRETTPIEVFEAARQAGRLWVARCGSEPVGFALVGMLAPRHAHLDELDVHPRHGGRGVGAALVRAVCAWAVRRGQRLLTLTTFRRLAWNEPFYARLGFEEFPGAALPPALLEQVQAETARGLDPERRLVMRFRPAAARGARPEKTRRRRRRVVAGGACDADS